MTIDVQDLVSRKTEETYPNFLILHPNDTIPVVIRSLEEGELQLIVEFKGTRKCVARISPSALNVDRLLRTVGSVEYVIGKGISTTLNCVEEYLGCVR